MIIKTKHLSKEYETLYSKFTVLDDVNLEIEKGQIVSIIGPSGAGKSTLLNVLGCLDDYDQGDLYIKGKNVSQLSAKEMAMYRNLYMGFIFQQHDLLPDFSAVENVMMPLLIRRESKKVAKKKALDIIDRFGLLGRAEHKSSELSGGECQRIAVARAIVTQPDIILADEPTGSLDSQNSLNLTKILFDLGREFDTTIIVVTHDLKIAEMTEQQITILDGKIRECVDNVSTN